MEQQKANAIKLFYRVILLYLIGIQFLYKIKKAFKKTLLTIRKSERGGKNIHKEREREIQKQQNNKIQ